MNQSLLLILGMAGFAVMPAAWMFTHPEGFSAKQGIKSFITGKVGRFIFILFILNTIGGAFWFWPKTPLDASLQIIGLIIFASGMFLAIWAKLVMKNSWNVPAAFEPEKQKKLITAGPFNFTRNPIYLGIILMIFGHGLALKSLFLPVLTIFCMHVRKLILIEEKHLSESFGQEYKDYQKRVPRFLFK